MKGSGGAQRRQNQPALVVIKMWVQMGIVKGDAQPSGLGTQVEGHLCGKGVESRVVFVGLWWNAPTARFDWLQGREAGSDLAGVGGVTWPAFSYLGGSRSWTCVCLRASNPIILWCA